MEVPIWHLQLLRSNKLVFHIELFHPVATFSSLGSQEMSFGDTMGYSTSQVTDHYLVSLDIDKTWSINEGFFQA